MKTLLYTEGPLRVTMGAAGTFERGVAKPLEDELADRLLAKTSLKFVEQTAAKQPKTPTPKQEA